MSIILVNWNANRFLVNCLRSIYANGQNLAFEVILVDNGSTDGGPDIVEEMFPEVQMIRAGGNLGFAKANNIGIEKSRGRYICLVNTDVEVVDRCLQDLVQYMDDHAELGVAGPQLLNADRTIQPSCAQFPSKLTLLVDALAMRSLFPRVTTDLDWEWGHSETCEVPWVFGALFMVRREAIDQVGVMDERFFFYAEERDWCKRFWEAGWRIAYFTGARAIHFCAGSSSAAPVRYAAESVRAQLTYWKKHHGVTGRMYARAVLVLHHAIRLIGRALGYAVFASRRPAMRYHMNVSAACLGLLTGLRRSF